MPRAKSWLFVDYEIEVAPGLDDNTSYISYQLERCPLTQRLHYQGVIVMKRACQHYFVQWCLNKDCHLEPCRNLEDVIAYSHKEDTRVAGPWSLGIKPVSYGRTDLLEIQQEIDNGAGEKDIARGHFINYLRYRNGIISYVSLSTLVTRVTTFVEVHWGVTSTGKTSGFWETWPNGYSKALNNTWWERYQGEEHILLDDFNPIDSTRWDINYWKVVLDRYPLVLDRKFGSITMPRHTHFYITSNHHPRYWWPAEQQQDRDAILRRLHSIIEHVHDPNYEENASLV
nr:MAG: replication associated protein [Cressdnaviricota sp.]